MITFGYKNRFTGPLRALTALAIGIVMVVSKANALNIAVQIIAAFLLASGLVSLIVGMINRQNGTLPLMAVNTVVDILIGLVLFMFPGFFANILVFFIALALLGFALFQSSVQNLVAGAAFHEVGSEDILHGVANGDEVFDAFGSVGFAHFQHVGIFLGVGAIIAL